MQQQQLSAKFKAAIVDEIGARVAQEIRAFRSKAELALAEQRAVYAEDRLAAHTRISELEQKIGTLERRLAAVSSPRAMVG